MFIGIDRMNEITAWQNANEAEPETAAMWFLVNFGNQWSEWVPDDVAERVHAALEVDGVADSLTDAFS
jgi:glycine betaine/proline transport system substrate-binding protein